MARRAASQLARQPGLGDSSCDGFGDDDCVGSDDCGLRQATVLADQWPEREETAALLAAAALVGNRRGVDAVDASEQGEDLSK